VDGSRLVMAVTLRHDTVVRAELSLVDPARIPAKASDPESTKVNHEGMRLGVPIARHPEGILVPQEPVTPVTNVDGEFSFYAEIVSVGNYLIMMDTLIGNPPSESLADRSRNGISCLRSAALTLPRLGSRS